MDIFLLGGALAASAVCLSLASTAISSFQKCGPNQAMIISGLGTESSDGQGTLHSFRIIRGGSAFVWPVIQERRFLSLEPMTVDVRSETPIITADGVSIFVEGKAQIKVKDDFQSIAAAAEQFLNKNAAEIESIANVALIGHLRAACGETTYPILSAEPEARAQTVLERTSADLQKIGLSVEFFNIVEIRPQSPGKLLPQESSQTR